MVGVAAGKGDGVALAADFFLLRAKRVGSPRGTLPQETSGLLLRGCVPPSCNGVCIIGKTVCISSIKFTSCTLNGANQERDRGDMQGLQLLEVVLLSSFMASEVKHKHIVDTL